VKVDLGIKFVDVQQMGVNVDGRVQPSGQDDVDEVEIGLRSLLLRRLSADGAGWNCTDPQSSPGFPRPMKVTCTGPGDEVADLSFQAMAHPRTPGVLRAEVRPLSGEVDTNPSNNVRVLQWSQGPNLGKKGP
jgi:hypothetical protein